MSDILKTATLISFAVFILFLGIASVAFVFWFVWITP